MDNGRSRYSNQQMYSIVIKNLPTDYLVNDLKNELQDIFSIFIEDSFNYNKNKVCKATVLASNGVLKGVAFVDFYKKEHMEYIIASTNRFKIGFNILNIEMKKKRN